MNSVGKSALLSALGVAALALTGTAMAAEEFTVDDSNSNLYDGGNAGAVGPVQANRLTGGYFEQLTLDAGGSFDAAAFWTAGQIFLDGTTDPQQPDNFGATGSDVGDNYRLYGTFTSSGTFSDPDFTGDTGLFQMYLDPNIDTDLSFTSDDAADGVTRGGDIGDDILVGTADNLVVADGSFNPGEDDIGSYTLIFDNWVLTAAGGLYFTDPDPFYAVIRASGQFNSETAIAEPSEGRNTFDINGSADLTYREVPAPGILALFGVGLLALGFTARRKGSMAG